MGGGRGYGPTHSQTLDKHFLGIPGLTVIAINNLIHPHAIYQALVTEKVGPVLLVENKVQYTQGLRSAPEGFRTLASNDCFPVVYVEPDSDAVDITLFGYGA
jgi:2-oxoisovalerate dehydrogenase E1 component